MTEELPVNPFRQARRTMDDEAFKWALLEFLDHEDICIYGVSIRPDNIAQLRKNLKALGLNAEGVQFPDHGVVSGDMIQTAKTKAQTDGKAVVKS